MGGGVVRGLWDKTLSPKLICGRSDLRAQASGWSPTDLLPNESTKIDTKVPIPFPFFVSQQLTKQGGDFPDFV